MCFSFFSQHRVDVMQLLCFCSKPQKIKTQQLSENMKNHRRFTMCKVSNFCATFATVIGSFYCVFFAYYATVDHHDTSSRVKH